MLLVTVALGLFRPRKQAVLSALSDLQSQQKGERK